MHTLPDAIVERLKYASSLDAAVRTALASFQHVIRAGPLPLFPSYTDHGPQHVAGVLDAALDLVTPGAWRQLNERDAATLVLAVVLHDAAMHLRRDGFQTLVTPDAWPKPDNDVRSFGDRDWPVLWREFLAEARRFDERTLIALFGSAEMFAMPSADVGRWRVWDDRQIALAGEFVRRHHPRIAHEIARYGVPGAPGERPLDPLASLRETPYGELADIAGVVARSHGIALRSALPYLESRYDHAESRRAAGVAAVFHMALLRIADYMQIAADRAPASERRLQRLGNPIARREWLTHAAVNEISRGRDPRALRVRASPQTVVEYLRLREWIDGIQLELDTSWAVLGEVYGRDETLGSLELSLRRVTSTVDDKGFAERTSFVPRRVRLEIAHGEMLKLLVRPLYGDRPEIGIRELLQNAVDSVRERADDGVPHPNQEPLSGYDDIRIDICNEQAADGGTDTWWLTITDGGMGMDERIVCEYFLRAGASLRWSDEWRKAHETVDGQPRVCRSGRFGVGVLAAFLLGDEIEVTTRHVHQAPERGLAFTVSLASDAIELRRATLPVGTTIRVRLSAERRNRLLFGDGRAHGKILSEAEMEERALAGQFDSSATNAWRWYELPWPHVRRSITGAPIVEESLLPPDAPAPLPPTWHRITDSPFVDVVWTYESRSTALYHNGFLVQTERPPLGRAVGIPVPLRAPCINVSDPAKVLPLRLQRDTFDGELPCLNELLVAIADDILAHTLVFAPAQAPSGNLSAWFGYNWPYPGVHGPQRTRGFDEYWSPVVAGSRGCTLLTDRRLLALGAQTTLVSFDDDIGGLSARDDCPILRAFHAPPDVDVKLAPTNGWLDRAVQMSARRYDASGAVATLSFAGDVLGRGSVVDYDILASSISKESAQMSLRDAGTSSWRAQALPRGTLIRASHGSPVSALSELATADLANRHVLIAAWYLNREALAAVPPTRLDSRWEEIFDLPYIPYAVRDRRLKLGRAYEALAPYVSHWEALAS